MRFLGGDYFPGSAAGERRDYLASLFLRLLSQSR